MAEENKNDITYFARTTFRGQQRKFGIKTDDRRRHMYLIGKTGMGKSVMMENMIINDIMAGRGVAVVDPHGELVEKIIKFIPKERTNDLIYFNPADTDYPLAFNILESVTPEKKHLVASGLMGVFTKMWANVWSSRMEYILNNCILALLDYPGSTLLGISRLLVDKKYRKKVVDNIEDPVVKSFWVNEFANYSEKFRTEAISPIQNKVGQFLSSFLIRNIVGQSKSTIDLSDYMNNNKILLLNLSKGRIGEDNSALLGAMMITKIQLAAMERVDIPEEERSDFYLYVDEFQNFATESFATILSEARKYRLNLIMGHQYIDQLVTSDSTKVRDAVFGNVGTIASFRVGAKDAEYLEKEYEPTFMQRDLVNLEKYNVYLKLMIDGVASRPFSAIGLAPVQEEEFSNLASVANVIKVSRERWGRERKIVEEKIMKWTGIEEIHEGGARESGINAGEEKYSEKPGGALGQRKQYKKTPSDIKDKTKYQEVNTAKEEPVGALSLKSALSTGPVDFKGRQIRQKPNRNFDTRSKTQTRPQQSRQTQSKSQESIQPRPAQAQPVQVQTQQSQPAARPNVSSVRDEISLSSLKPKTTPQTQPKQVQTKSAQVQTQPQQQPQQKNSKSPNLLNSL